MRKEILLLTFAAFTMLAGCTRGEDSLHAAEETADNSIIVTEECISEETDNAPAGIDTVPVHETQSEEITMSDGVSLIKGEYDYLRNMIDFGGEYTDLEQLGYEYYSFSCNEVFSGYADCQIRFKYSDEELLYFDIYDGGTAAVNVLGEYNVRTGEQAIIVPPEGCDEILYADRDYIIYYSLELRENELSDAYYTAVYYCMSRDTGKAARFYEDYANTVENIVRCGNSFYFNTYEYFISSDGGIDAYMYVLNRYIPNQDYLMKIKVGAEILSGREYGLILMTPRGLCQYDIYSEGLYFTYSLPNLYLDGEQTGYVSAYERSDIFGERCEVGRLIPYGNYEYYVKPVFHTYYGTSVNGLVISAQSAAAVSLSDGTMLLIDFGNNTAAVINDKSNAEYHCSSDGDWLYFSDYNSSDAAFIAVNTLI